MTFKVSSLALNSHMGIASKVLAAKNSLPILECFLFEVNDGYLTITASDSEKSFITTIPTLEQSGNGRFCISARKMMDSTREIPEQPLALDFNEDTLELRANHNTGSFTLMAQNAEPYPTPRAVEGECMKVILSGKTILSGLNRCLFATANDEVRVVMNGVFFEMHSDYITFAATDGRKLVKDVRQDVHTGIEGSFIMPKKVATILKNVVSADEDVDIRFVKDRATIVTQDMMMHFRLIDGNYPNYNAVIPTNNPYRAVIDRQSLASALKRVLVFCNQSSGLVKLELDNGTIRLTGQDNDFATRGEEFLNCDYNGSRIAIGFSCQFMVEICNILESENVILELADPARPGIIRPEVPQENEEILMLLMPMRVED